MIFRDLPLLKRTCRRNFVQLGHQLTADEAGSTNDQYPHALCQLQ